MAANLNQLPVDAASLIQTLSWKNRKAKVITKAEDGVLEQALVSIIPLIGEDSVIEKLVD